MIQLTMPLSPLDRARMSATQIILSKSKPQRNGCRLWTGPVDKWGYGRITFNGNSRGVHRIIYAEKFGLSLKESDIIRHTCDTPSCVNVEHLLMGSHADNVRDRCARGRSAVGHKNGRSKLTEAQAVAIFDDRRVHRIIALEYGVDPRVVGRIKGGLSWISATSFTSRIKVK